MAESYFTDPAYEKPSVLQRLGDFAVRVTKVLDFTKAVGLAFGYGVAFIPVVGQLTALTAWGVDAGKAMLAPVTYVKDMFIGGSVLAGGIVAGARTLQAAGELSKGNYRKAFSKTIRGAVEGAMVYANFTGVAMIPEVISLLATGKFLSTHAGEWAEKAADEVQNAILGPSKAKQQAPALAQGMAPQIQMAQGMAPTMMMQPQMMMPQPVYYMNAQPMPMMQPGMVPTMAVPAAVGTPPQPVIMQAAPATSWTQRVAPEGPAVQQVIQPKAANGFVQAEAARTAAAAQQGPTVGQPG